MSSVMREYFISLLKSSILKTQPKEIPEGTNFAEIFNCAKSQKVAALIYYAIDKLSNGPDVQLMKKWETEYFEAIRNDATQQYEYEKLVKNLTENNIKVMPLKGCIMKNMYPKTDMRTMCDIDVLYSCEDYEQVRKLMESNGYEILKWNKIYHDSFYKLPVTNVELHRNLVEATSKNRRYFDLAWERAVRDRENPNLYYMTDEDFYIFMVQHAASHFNEAGLGIRPFIDIFIYLDNKKQLDFDYIKRELDILKLTKFEAQIRKVVRTWFCDEPCDLEVKKIEEFVFSNGIYGNSVSAGTARIASVSKGNDGLFVKMLFVLKSTFPGRLHMQENFKILKKAPVLIPVFWIVRWFNILFFKRFKFNTVLGPAMKASADDIKRYAEIMKIFGL
ncbi:MAG: nucleotidyltransferase family protein [bacterium]|nr:nucleotidyltransferase family protein [bacterium]